MTHTLGLVHVLDDNDDIRKMLTLVLEGRGYRVQTHDSGAAFLQAPSTQAPHVMLLDVRMPGMSGLELHAQMKATGNTMPVIFMSGESQPHEIQAVNRSGALYFLWKPFCTQEMLRVISEALGPTGLPISPNSPKPN
jgi:FixJ family two-component response regulator